MTNTPAPAPLDRTQQAHRLAVLVYLLYLLGILFGVTALVGVIINHTNLPKTRDTHAYSHFVWQIASFWILCAGVAFVVILWPGMYGELLMYLCFLWWIASALTGIWYLVKNKPIPFIKTAGIAAAGKKASRPQP